MKNTILSFLFVLSNTILFSQVGTYSYLQPRTPVPNWTTAENPTEVGEFSIAHAMSMYVSVKSPNQFARARVFAHHNSNSDHPILIRAFDTDERLTHWQLIPTKGASPLFYPEDTYDNSLPALPLTTSSGTTINDAGFAFADQGVHQIRVNAGISTTKAKVVFSQDLEYGVSFQNGSYRAWAGHPGTMYFYIPKNAVTLDFNVSAGPLLLKDQNGIVKPLDPNFDIDLLPSDYDQVWSIDLPSNFKFSVKGMPFIMCTSVALANEVHASVEEGPNGEVVSHKWQVNLLNIKKDILQNGNLGDPTIMVLQITTMNQHSGS